MELRAFFIRLDAGNGDSSEIGFVKVEDGASYATLREEIKNDELDKLMGHGFVFLPERNLPLSKKQERRYKVEGDEIVVRITDDINSQPSKRPRIIIEELEEESNMHSDIVEVNRDVSIVNDSIGNDSSKGRSSSGSCEGKMRSKLATKAELFKWRKEMTFYTTKMRHAGRQDRFELMYDDVNGRAVFYIWCVECNQRYGKGGSDTMYNFTARHCKTKAHNDNSQRHNVETNMTENPMNEECTQDIIERNKSMVEKSMLDHVNPFVEQSGVLFELYKDSIAGYVDLGSICIACKLCNKSILLFPPAESVPTNMKQHIQLSSMSKKPRQRRLVERRKLGSTTQEVDLKSTNLTHNKRAC